MKYGVLFEENNSDGLIEAVTLLLENKKTYLKLKNKSFERAQFFDKENVIKKWEYELLN